MIQNKIYTLVMRRGGGKTPFVLGGDYEEGAAKIWLRKGMSTLVIDDFDHPKYKNVPILHPDHYKKLSEKPGIYRTLCANHLMPKLFPLLKNVYNTLLVFEDCYKYFDQRFTDDQISIIGDSKQKNVDLMFMHWCWGWVQPDLLRCTNYFVIGETSDTPEVRETYLRGCFNECMKAYGEVKSGKAKPKNYLIVDSGI